MAVSKVDVGDFIIGSIRNNNKEVSGGSLVTGVSLTVQNPTTAPVTWLTVTTPVETITAEERFFVLQSTNIGGADTWVISQ